MFKPGKKISFNSSKELPPTPASIGDMTHNFTGSWRNLKPVIDYEKCIDCMICWKFCPEPAIFIEKERPKIDYYFCKGCGICVTECPVKCIAFEEEGK
jgi:2-oxoacid:acceptor oxidoreductase delta subunit (pyruvate/2-ketoisovalerate family)